MTSVSLPAYAKVNLHLSVLGKRPDGYHELLTLFERVDLSDHVTVQRMAGGGIELECDSSDLPHDATNLAVRAVEVYRRASGWSDGVRIRLEKSIPIGAGLGGGSSDAAAVLVALQRLSDSVIPEDQLFNCARDIGADVAFFVARVPWALGRGRGDQIEPVSGNGRIWHLLVTPDFAISTRAVYQAFGLTAPGPDVKLLLRALKGGPSFEVRELLFNGLEPTVEALYPEIRHVKAVVQTPGGLVRPCVSGSGSTVFAVCDSEAQARTAADQIRRQEPGWRVHVVATA